jgi:hypothetical protein
MKKLLVLCLLCLFAGQILATPPSPYYIRYGGIYAACLTLHYFGWHYVRFSVQHRERNFPAGTTVIEEVRSTGKLSKRSRFIMKPPSAIPFWALRIRIGVV